MEMLGALGYTYEDETVLSFLTFLPIVAVSPIKTNSSTVRDAQKGRLPRRPRARAHTGKYAHPKRPSHISDRAVSDIPQYTVLFKGVRTARSEWPRPDCIIKKNDQSGRTRPHPQAAYPSYPRDRREKQRETGEGSGPLLHRHASD